MGRQSSITLPAMAWARDQRSPRRMLALVSINNAIRRRSRVAEIQRGRLTQERPGKCESQQAKRGRPQQEQEPVIQSAPPRQPRRGRREEHQRAEWHFASRRSTDQVKNDRSHDRREPRI